MKIQLILAALQLKLNISRQEAKNILFPCMYGSECNLQTIVEAYNLQDILEGLENESRKVKRASSY